MKAEEKMFCEAVAKKYCGPTPSNYHSSLSLMDAAYEVAKEQGAVIQPDEEGRKAFFRTFMNGLMNRDETLKYIDGQINNLNQRSVDNAIHENQAISRLTAEMAKSMKAIVDAALIIRAKSGEVNRLSKGIYPALFNRNSREWDSISDVARQIGITL